MKNSGKKSEYQVKFFTQIKKTLPAHKSLVSEVCDLLNLADDAAYRRINGKQLLDFDEIVKLCQHFKISLDSIVGAADQNLLQCKYAPHKIRDIGEYVKYVQTVAADIKRFRMTPGCELLLTAADIPAFNFLAYKELTLFHTFSWQKILFGFSAGFDGFLHQFDVEKFAKGCKEISSNYELIPSSEIWMTNTMDSTIKLIIYHYRMGHFSNESIPLLLCSQLLEMINTLHIWLEKGSKGADNTPYKFYLSEIDIGNTFFLLKNEALSVSMLRLYMINGLSISDESFCDETAIWHDNLIKRSTLVSGSSDFERQKFINAQLQKIEILKEEILRTK